MMTTEVPEMLKGNNRKALFGFFEDVCAEYGEVHGEKIIMKFITHCGSLRLRVPDHDELYRMGRDRLIKKQYLKGTASITSLMFQWDLSRAQILRIVNEE